MKDLRILIDRTVAGSPYLLTHEYIPIDERRGSYVDHDTFTAATALYAALINPSSDAVGAHGNFDRPVLFDAMIALGGIPRDPEHATVTRMNNIVKTGYTTHTDLHMQEFNTLLSGFRQCDILSAVNHKIRGLGIVARSGHITLADPDINRLIASTLRYNPGIPDRIVQRKVQKGTVTGCLAEAIFNPNQENLQTLLKWSPDQIFLKRNTPLSFNVDDSIKVMMDNIHYCRPRTLSQRSQGELYLAMILHSLPGIELSELIPRLLKDYGVIYGSLGNLRIRFFDKLINHK